MAFSPLMISKQKKKKKAKMKARLVPSTVFIPMDIYNNLRW